MTGDPFGAHAMTFDDVLLQPGYSEVLPGEVSLAIRLSPAICLNVPIVSAAMDKVTEARMAIALAREGGIGVIHRNMSVEDQAAEVDKVKRSESGMIVDPITLPRTATLAQAEELMARYHISGIPITETDGKLVGILTNRDIRFVTEGWERPVSEFMTSERLVTAPIDTTLEEAKNILQKHRIEKLPLIDEQGFLKGLITVKDIQKKQDFPRAATDTMGRLLVAAAVGVGDAHMDRVAALVEVGVDAIGIDTAHGHSKNVLKAVQAIKARYPALSIIAGNVATAEGTQALIDAGADVVKVGVGAGSICTTRIVTGVGVPQLYAIQQCAAAAHALGKPIIADGGLKYSGDIVKALAAGADAVMLGSLLAGLDECPGEVLLLEGRRYKDYRGMGSLGAMTEFSRDRYGSGQSGPAKTVPEGIEGRVPFKGHLSDLVYQLSGGIRSGMGYVGAVSIEELHTKAKWVRITASGLIESHPHSVILTKEAPNYSPPEFR
jgi:IMP dehydrogenase